MPRSGTRTTNRTAAHAAGTLAAAALLGACAAPISPARFGLGSGGERVGPDDFVAAEGEPTPVRAVRTGPPIEPDNTPELAAGNPGARRPADAPARTAPDTTTGADGVVTRPGAPTPSTRATPAGEPVLLNAKVGDLNGRPIFADEFLLPIADRLRAEATRMRPQEWLRFASEQVYRRVQEVLRDELLRSEALASLSPEVRQQGLRGFIESVRTELVSQRGGSEQLVRRDIRETKGLTLEQELRDRQESALVYQAVRTELLSRVNISWRDIVQRYERDIELYNPPPSAVFRVIRVRTDDTESVDAVRTMLDAGTPFAEVASSEHNGSNPTEGGLQTELLSADGYTETEFFGPEALNELAWGLSPGSWGGPVEFGSFTAWLMLDRIETTSVSLYDAQLQIADDLLQERLLEEQNRYITRLVERARVTGIEDLTIRLLEIAADRYGPRTE